MSAIRTHRSHRSAQLPYARPPAKKSTWSLIGLLSYFNPLRSRSPVDSIDSSVDSDGDEQTPNRQVPPIAQSLSARGHQMAQDIDSHGRINALAGPSSQVHQPSVPPPLDTFEPPSTPTRSAVPHLLQDSHSPANNIERVSNFLSERAGKSISNSEVEGIVALLRQNTPPADKPETFRFTSRLSTPVRESSPLLPNTNDTSYSFNTRAPQTFTPSPRKTLSKNPNGVYRWEGLGSAKAQRSRNRYSSPAFGPSRPSSDRLVLKESQTVSEAPKTDAKRRKVGDEAQNSSGGSSTGTNGNLPLRSPAPGPSPNRTSQAFPFPVSSGSPVPSRPPVATPTPAPQLNGLSTATRLRTPAKPTAPVVPSPLRQAWSGSSSSSKIVSPPPQTIQKQTKAANFMTELIKEVTPPKRPDLSNPYQTASPVGKVVLPKPRVGKRIRATGKPAVPPATDDKSKEQSEPTEKEKEYSHQAIIEATLPKGSKRSRPPAHFEKSPSISDFSLSPPAPDTPSSLLDDERHPVINEQSKTTSYLVEEMDDDEQSERTTKRLKPYPTRESKSMTPTPDIVIEEMDDMDVQNPVQKPQIPASAPTSIFSAPGSGATSPTKASGRPLFPAFKPTLPKEPSKLRFSYQPEPGTSSAAPAPGPVTSVSDAPPPPAGGAVQSVRERDEKIQVSKKTSKEAALAIPRDALPTFIFSITTVLTSASIPSHLNALEEAKAVPKSSLPSFDFSLAKLNSNVEVPKLVPPPVKAFDWGAAGMKKPTNSADGSGPWMCSTCMLSNPATAIDKCSICQAPRS